MTNMVNMTNSGHGKRPVYAGRDHRFVVMLTGEEYKQINEFRHAQKIGTLATAARRLIADGLKMNAATGNEIGVLAPVAAGEKLTR